jgi:hypothetical protein
LYREPEANAFRLMYPAFSSALLGVLARTRYGARAMF